MRQYRLAPIAPRATSQQHQYVPSALCDVISAITEFMVSAAAAASARSSSVATYFTVSTSTKMDTREVHRFKRSTLVHSITILECKLVFKPEYSAFPSRTLVSFRSNSVNRQVSANKAFGVGRNLQCQPVRGVNIREEFYWSHAWQRFKRSKGVKLNGILECKCLSKTRTVQQWAVRCCRCLCQNRQCAAVALVLVLVLQGGATRRSVQLLLAALTTFRIVT
jgi:hypothetical protein